MNFPPAPLFSYEALLEKKKNYQECQYHFSLSQKIDFINQLEEQACRFFLKQEELLEKNSSNKINKFTTHASAEPIISFLKELDAISKELEIYFQKNHSAIECDKSEDLILGCNTIYYVREGGKLKIFKPDSASNDFEVGVKMGIPTRERASLRAHAAFLVSKALELDLVPETLLGTDQGSRGMLQEVVDGFHFYEKKLFKISEKEIEDLASCHGIEFLNNAVFGNASGEGNNLPLNYGLLLEAPLKREGGCKPVFKNGIPLSKNKIKAFFLLGKISLGKKQLYKTYEVDFSNPTLQKQMADAQVFDFITGQLDRSACNFIFKKEKPDIFSLASSFDEEKIILKLLDHDYTFPSRFIKLDEETKNILSKESILTELPPLVDKTTAHKIITLDFQTLARELLFHGLTQDEVEACRCRWEIMKEHLEHLNSSESSRKNQGERITSIWDQETYEFLIQERKNEQGEVIYNNYISKNREETETRSAIFEMLQQCRMALS